MSDAFDEKLAKLAKLEANWDSYGGKPVDPAVIERVREFLKMLPALMPRTRIVPGSDGSIQLEWSNGGNELEIEFHLDGTMSFLQCGLIDRSDQAIPLMQWVSVK